jgi:hypothetical protein
MGVIIAALPASLVARFLPPSLVAEDFSGTVWHGSAGRLSIDGRDTGAFEWRLHPAALLRLAAEADVHWVKTGFVIDALIDVDNHGYSAHAIKGGGPVEDLRALGVADSWSGSAAIDFSELTGTFAQPSKVVGDIQVSNLASARLAEGANLGGYDLRFGDGAVGADGTVTTQVKDTGGPLDVQAQVHFDPKQNLGLLSGSVKERPSAPPALLQQLQNLSQMRGRDPQGRIPIDLEFSTRSR